MYINFIILPFIVIFGLLLSDKDKNRMLFIIVISLILLLESALRNLYLIADTYTYYETFTIKVPSMTWSEIWKGFVDRYFGQGAEEYDFGFYIIQKIIGSFTDSFQVFTFISQLIYFVPMGIFLYRYSQNMRQLIFAFVFYVAIIHFGAIGGGRQVLARGCWIMAFMMINDTKYIKGAIWLLIGLTFHFSILVVLLAVALGFLKPVLLKNIHLFAFLALPFVFFSPTQLILFMANISGTERYATYGEHTIAGGATTFITLMMLLSLFCFIMIRKDELERNNYLKKVYAMLPCLTIFTPLMIADGVMIRLSNYFHMFLMLLIPYAIEQFKDKKIASAVYVIMVGVLCFLALKDGGLKYYFFWQDVGYRGF